MTKLTARRASRQLGLRVIELRQSLNLTQEDLAERIGWGPRQMQRVEAGTNLSVDGLVKLANALGVDLPTLLQPPSRRIQRRPGRPKKA